MTYRKTIMALPAAERLEYALTLLDELTGADTGEQVWVERELGLSPQQARFFLILNAAAPRTVTKAALFDAVWGESDTNPKIVDVIVCYMRAKNIEIITDRGKGYALKERIEIGTMTPEIVNRGRPWTAENDADLANMLANGSTLRAMAYELDRTERGVNERIALLKRK